jgi:4-carboxymuconolactone decarboxylase
MTDDAPADPPIDEALTSTDRRERGQAWMRQVYGWDLPEVSGRFVELTVDHLFGEVWAGEGLTVKERRLLLVGLLVGLGEHDVVELQLDAALRLAELTPEELRDMTLLTAHYAGWPRGAKLNSAVEALLARHARTHPEGGGSSAP